MIFPFGEPAELVRAARLPSGYSGDSEGRLDWRKTEVVEVWQSVAVAPASSSEAEEVRRAPVTSTLTLYGVPVTSTVTAADRVKVRGRIYGVDGDPEHFRSPFTGWEPGLIVNLKKVEG